MTKPLIALKSELIAKGIRPTYQRIKVLEYLYDNNTHPSVERILQHLSSQIPSLSKATVYNNLRTLISAGLVREINIDDNEACFDAILAPHGHFCCEDCGAIINFDIDIESIPVQGLIQFQISSKDVFFKGLCPNCQKKGEE
jgi:Fur family peroxide stress response transcriptional regulator